MDAHSFADMLARDYVEWRALVAVLDSRPDQSVHGQEDPDWNARDVYSHMARWINHSTDDLEATLAGECIPRPTGTDDEINARWQAEDSQLSLTEARQQAHRAFDRRVLAIESIAPTGWTPKLDEIARADGYKHFEAHRRYIESADPRV